jgi:hypothetical protein
MPLGEKAAMQQWSLENDIFSSRVWKVGCRIAPISRDFRSEAVEFLCNSDCMAERAVWR